MPIFRAPFARIPNGCVLRNLTTCDYVRCRPGKTIPIKHGYVSHPNIGSLNIADVVLMRTIWAGRTNWTIVGTETDTYVRGEWAGHCFDIVPLEGDVAEEMEKGWRDCTDEIVEQAFALFNELPINLTTGKRKKNFTRKTWGRFLNS
jgi:hypothetical protein